MTKWWKRLWLRTSASPVTPAAPAPPKPKRKLRVNWNAFAKSQTPKVHKPAGWVDNPFVLPEVAPGVIPLAPDGKTMIAMDWAGDVQANFAWALVVGQFQEGLGFLGYQYLAQLAQRPEYRRIVEIHANEMTRKWIKVTASGTGKADKVKAMEEALVKHKVQAIIRESLEVEGFFGRSQLFVDIGTSEDNLDLPLVLSPATIGKGKLKGFKLVEPMWSSPGAFNSNSPLRADFYVPHLWYVQSQLVHASRLLTFVCRKVPDMLKPAYSFGGLSLTQMAKPYVDNWLRTRQSVSDIIHAFSVMVLSTNMDSILGGEDGEDVLTRLQVFNNYRDNQGVFAIDKDTETFENVSAPLSGLHELQAQSQEQMASVAAAPLVVLLGITPAGLNASSEGEIAVFYGWINSRQEKDVRPNLKTMFDIIQLSEFGEIDPGLSFSFVPLGDQDAGEEAVNDKTQADTDAVYIQAGVVDPEEVRARLAGDDESPYHGLDLTKVIEAPADPSLEPNPDDEDDPGEEKDAA